MGPVSLLLDDDFDDELVEWVLVKLQIDNTRGFTLPSAKTESAKAARSAFYCDLCQKGYSRMNEFEQHESSYDHQHKKRLKEMKEMQRQVQVSHRKEEKGPVMSIKLGNAPTKSSGGGGFKKGGFKNAFAASEISSGEAKIEADADTNMPDADQKTNAEPVKNEDPEEVDSDITDEEDYYDPAKPTCYYPAY